METSSKNAGPLIVERSYKAPVEKVWEALTDVNKMRQWYFDIPEFKPEPGFEFEFTAGDGKIDYVHQCVVQEVIPNKKLSYTWRYADYPGDSLVTFELFEEDGGSKVRITHTGLETFPDLPSFARSSFNGGWEHILGVGLKDFVEKA
jgi:uncharacterized protein YndB with AHSA1/START domain